MEVNGSQYIHWFFLMDQPLTFHTLEKAAKEKEAEIAAFRPLHVWRRLIGLYYVARCMISNPASTIEEATRRDRRWSESHKTLAHVDVVRQRFTS